MSYSYEKNPYYHPEKLGFQVVAEIEYSDLNYNYDTRVVWRDEDGQLVTARDAGCSCPTPFADCSILPVNYRELEEEVKAELKSDYGHVTAATGRDFLTKVRTALEAA
jgi:hypothetical protein